MKIVQPYAKLLTHQDQVVHTQEPLYLIEKYGRVSHRAEDAQTIDSWKRFIQAVVLDKGDWSIVEHVSASVEMLVDRGVTHELVRHRLCSFTQESTRFVNYEKRVGLNFVYPRFDQLRECDNGCQQGVDLEFQPWELPAHIWPNGELKTCEAGYDPSWCAVITTICETYGRLIKDGWRPQETRSVLPNALASKIIVTANLRNWRHLFIMRTTKETHPQFRQVMVPLLAEFQAAFPLLYDDLVPNVSQAENLRKPR